MALLSRDVVPGSLYVYTPNQIAPIVFASVFFASLACHVLQCFLFRCWKVMGFQPFCAILFTTGFAMRAYQTFNHRYFYNSHDNQSLLIYILSQVFIYIAPPLYELSNYHVLGHVFHYVPHAAPMPPSLTLSVFGGLMLLVEALNGIGVAFSSNPSTPKSKQDLGSHLTVASVVLQVLVVLTFAVMGGWFQYRCGRLRNRIVNIMMATLYTSMVFILIRGIYRLVEHTQSVTISLTDASLNVGLSPLLKNEWFFYGLDAVPMALNSILWNVLHPGHFLPNDKYTHLDRHGKEVQDEKTLETTAREDGVPKLLSVLLLIFTFGAWNGKGLKFEEYRKKSESEESEGGHGMTGQEQTRIHTV